MTATQIEALRYLADVARRLGGKHGVPCSMVRGRLNPSTARVLKEKGLIVRREAGSRYFVLTDAGRAIAAEVRS